MPDFAEPAGLFMAGRAMNLIVGLAMIPMLVHFLGGLEFATWAVLLSSSIVFAQLHLGIPTALAFEVAVTARSKPELVSRLWSSAAVFLAGVHAVLLPVVVTMAPRIGEWLRLPNVGTWPPGVVLVFVFLCVAARSVLLTGSAILLGFFHFRRAAAFALAQALLSNVAASAVAAVTGHLAETLAAFWTVQLAVAAAAFVGARRTGARPAARLMVSGLASRLLRTGLTFQIAEWAQTINFQFDKFVIVRVLGLWPAALYEVANRSVLALRSIPASSTETMLPIAAHHAATGGSTLGQTRRLMLLALHGALLFCAAPCAVAPVFLYAWVGEMGYVSRYVFVWLAVGAAANLFALPIATLTQAAGHPRVQASAALCSIAVNVLLSVTLVHVWGVPGAAFGSSLAMLLGTAVLVRQARGTLGAEVTATLRLALVRHLPVIAACLACGILIHLAFGHWILKVPLQVRYALGLRVMGAFTTVGLYIACVLVMVGVKLKVVGLDEDERIFVARLAAAGARLRAS
jgi:O-antigen/teichoic acid export membrane protein